MDSVTEARVRVGGPYFEDFEVGQVFDDAPALTLTPGTPRSIRRWWATVCASRSTRAWRRVTGTSQALAHPNLVCDVAIGQSTGPTQRVRGNLFYRGLVLLRPVFIGDTLRTGRRSSPSSRTARATTAATGSWRCGSARSTSATSRCSTSGAAR